MEVSSSLAKLWYLKLLRGENGDFAVKQDLTLLCAVVPVSGKVAGSGVEAYRHRIGKEKIKRERERKVV